MGTPKSEKKKAPLLSIKETGETAVSEFLRGYPSKLMEVATLLPQQKDPFGTRLQVHILQPPNPILDNKEDWKLVWAGIDRFSALVAFLRMVERQSLTARLVGPRGEELGRVEIDTGHYWLLGEKLSLPKEHWRATSATLH